MPRDRLGWCQRTRAGAPIPEVRRQMRVQGQCHVAGPRLGAARGEGARVSFQNGVMMQYFHWYTPADGTLWDEVAARAGELSSRGVTALWLPPAYKGVGGANDVGYGAYDLYD